MRLEGPRHTFALAIGASQARCDQPRGAGRRCRACAAADRAQGLNMGLRDASDIIDIVTEALGRADDRFGAGAGTVRAGALGRYRQPLAGSSIWPTARCSAISCRRRRRRALACT